MTVKGIDISHWQDPTPSLDGLSFVCVKATQGLTTDPSWAKHGAAVKKAGLVLIAYAFGVDSLPARDQARYFLDVVGASTKVVALDVEGPNAPSQDQITEWMRVCKAAGKTTLLYHSASGFPHGIGQDANWIAQWGTDAPEGSWAIWQYRGAPLDLDLWHGTEASLHAFAGTAPKPKPKPPAHLFVHVKHGDTLGGTAKAHHITTARLLKFPENAKYRHNPNLIHIGDRVRVK